MPDVAPASHPATIREGSTVRSRGLRPEVRALLMATVLTAALMPAVPDEVVPSTVLFTAAFVLLAAVSLTQRVAERGTWLPTPAVLFLGGFFVSIALSYSVAASNGVAAATWMRGAAPFAFLSVLLFLPVLSPSDVRLVFGALYVSCCLWAIKVLAMNLPEFIAGEATRFTALTMDVQLPYDVIGLTLTLFVPFIGRRRASWVLGALFAAIIIATGYRSRLLLMLIALGVWVWQRPSKARFALVGAAALGAIGAFGGLLLSDSAFWADYSRRFSELGEEAGSARAAEIAYGLAMFARSPVVGNGLQFPVPIAVTYFGRPDSDIGDLGSTVGYLHNVWVYLLMDLGVIGLLAYLGCFAAALWQARRSEGPSLRVSNKFAAVALIAVLLLYFTVEAAFRQVQMNLILGLAVAVLAKSTDETEAAAD